MEKAGLLVLSSQKVLSGYGRAGGLRLMGKYIGHRLVARPEPDKRAWDLGEEKDKEVHKFPLNRGDNKPRRCEQHF